MANPAITVPTTCRTHGAGIRCHQHLCCCLVTKSCPTLCNPPNCRTPWPGQQPWTSGRHIKTTKNGGSQPARLLCPWDFPGKNTGAGCHFLLQRIFQIQGSNPHLLHWQADSLPLSHQGNPLAPSESWILNRLVKIPNSYSLKLSSLKQSIKLSEEISGNSKPTHKHRELCAMTAPDYNPVVLERTTSFMALTVVLMLLLQKVLEILSKSTVTTDWSKLGKIQTQ